MIEPFSIKKLKAGYWEVIEDAVAKEIPFTLIVNDTELATLLSSPIDLEDLATGFLFTSGFIQKKSNIKKMKIDEKCHICSIQTEGKEFEKMKLMRLQTSGCGKGTFFYNAMESFFDKKIVSDFNIKSDEISRLMQNFQKKSQVYLQTGGVHSAALADKKNILIFREDIGRHNAIDKVIGCRLAQEKTFRNHILLTSGRITSEVLLKVRRCEIPMIVSRSAPTDQAVKHARQMGISLIGFARADRMNIYSEEKMVLLQNFNS